MFGSESQVSVASAIGKWNVLHISVLRAIEHYFSTLGAFLHHQMMYQIIHHLTDLSLAIRSPTDFWGQFF